MHLNQIQKCPICKNALDIYHTGRGGCTQVFGIAPRQGFGVLTEYWSCSQNFGAAPRVLLQKILGALQNPGSNPKSWEHFKILGVLQNSGSTPKSWEHSKILGVLQSPESSHPFLHHVTFMRMTKKPFTVYIK